MSESVELQKLVSAQMRLSQELERDNFRLRTSEIPEYIYDFIATEDPSKLKTDIKQELTPENYREQFSTLLNLEHAFQVIELRRLDQLNVQLINDEPDLFSMDRPPVSNEKLMRSNTLALRQGSTIYCGYIDSIHDRQVRIKKHYLSREFPNRNGVFDVMWVKAERAIEDYMERLSQYQDTPFVREVLFPDQMPMAPDFSVTCKGILDQIDAVQMSAVNGILNHKKKPMPYIIYGPPGTGKTRTLIEAILQVHRESRYSKILVCTLYNECIDELVIKILKTGHVDPDHLVRVIPPKRKIPEDKMLRRVTKDRRSNFRGHSIIATTYGVASQLRLRFDYVFLDEAHRFLEPETLVLLDLMKYQGCFVMVGDPQQPGPVCLYPVARDNGLGTSLLERLCKRPLYRHDVSSGENPPERAYTKLTTCYRSDPRLMAINNKLFYNNELKCLASTPQDYLDMLGVSKPVLFEEIKQAEEEQELATFCWFNSEEVDICLNYIRKFQSNKIDVENQVGIIAPSKAQVENLYAAIEREGLPRCKIGSVRKFSGEERDIILISAVRTHSDPTSEFLFDPKQFNITTSRAKFMLIVIGHEKTLRSSPYWTEFIESAERLTSVG